MRITLLISFMCCLGLSNAIAQSDVVKGIYCTIEDQRNNVFIFINPKDCKPNTYENFIQCRSQINSNVTWLEASSLKWFTVIKDNSLLQDSFVVSRSSMFKDHGFVQVILNGKHYKIYRVAPYNRIRHHAMPVGDSLYVGAKFTAMRVKKEEHVWYTADGRDTYLFGTEPNNLTELTRSIFPDIMPLIMADKPEIVKAINKKEFKYGQLVELINYYKTGIKPSK
jgi:hypothetical protein